MKLIVFLDMESKLCQNQKNEITKLLKTNLLDGIDKKLLETIDEQYQTAISTIIVEKCERKVNPEAPPIIRHKIICWPTLLLVNEGVGVYRWENNIPSQVELITTIKNYLKLLEWNTDYEYDPEE